MIETSALRTNVRVVVILLAFAPLASCWQSSSMRGFFRALTVHVPTNTVAYAFRMDPGAPDFPSHFHICRAMSFTTKGWFGYQEGSNRVGNGMFSYEAAGSFHTPFSDCPEGFEARGVFEGDSDMLLQNHASADPQSDIVGYLKVQDFIDIASKEAHIVHANGAITGDSHFKYDFSNAVLV